VAGYSPYTGGIIARPAYWGNKGRKRSGAGGKGVRLAVETHCEALRDHHDADREADGEVGEEVLPRTQAHWGEFSFISPGGKGRLHRACSS
jgi:hypothetical protein